ncbi:MAG: VOC family protein [Gammaproteobacteria bacterium]|nr:VOC family protein [Gammaproteobacteria bacterium]
MTIRIEHANMIVRDIDATARFLTTAFPEFRIRRQGGDGRQRWLHIGTDDTYIALNEATAEPAEPWTPYTGKPGVNHLGYAVEDVEALRQRLRAAGYEDSTVPNSHPFRKRVYFRDPDGNDWEFVQYYSDKVAERNDYELPDSG